MKQKLMLALLCLACYLPAQTQDKKPAITDDHWWFLKTAPLSLLETDAGPSFIVEYMLPKKRLGFQLKVQPVLYNAWGETVDEGINEPDNTIKSSEPLGIEVRPELKYYLGHGPRRHRGGGAYLSLDLAYKYTDTKRLGAFPVNNGSGQPVFIQDILYSDTKKVYTVAVKYGIRIPFSNNKWMAEMAVGFGVKYRDFTYKGLPPGVSNPERPVFWSNTNDEYLPAMPIDLMLVYRLP